MGFGTLRGGAEEGLLRFPSDVVIRALEDAGREMPECAVWQEVLRKYRAPAGGSSDAPAPPSAERPPS